MDSKKYLDKQRYKIKTKDHNKIRILIYGRPSEKRNCFESIVDGLSNFFKTLPKNERINYSIISVGESHENIILQPGIVIKSLGKLTIEGYIQHLEKSHIGISLMASPHPSYPPLEMATFGLYTITNKFENKDISKNHPMIHSIDYPLPEDVSKELKKAVDYVKTKSYKIITATIPTNMNKVSWARNIEGAHIAPINSNNLK